MTIPRIWAVVAAGVCICGASQAAGQKRHVDPATFVRSLYADEVRDELNPHSLWTRRLSNRLQSLKARVDALSPESALPFLDYDWLCQCQDPGGVRFTVGEIAKGARRAAIVNVQMHFLNNDRNSVRLVLVDENGWKVDDIIDQTGKRYSDALKYNIAHKGR